MKRKVLISSLMMVLVLVAATVGAVAAKVGVVNLNVVIDESRAGRQANQLLADFIEERQDILAPIESELEALARIIDEGSEVMTADDLAATQRQFDDLAQGYVTLLNQFELEINGALEDLRNQLLADIGVILQMVGDDGDFDIIVDVASAYYYRRAIDLTFEVIRKYDDLWGQVEALNGQVSGESDE